MIKKFSLKNCTLLIIFIVIYTYFFYKLGNTLFRTNSEGIKVFSIIPLITEGIIGPIRSFFLLLFHGNFFDCLNYLWLELFRLSNPFSVIIFIYYIHKIIKRNLL